jgi:hypothetical protein
VTLVKAYVYFLVVSATGCAYGLAADDFVPKPDSGMVHVDAGHDVATHPEASVEDSASQDEPDVVQVEACNPPPLSSGDPTCDTCIAASCCSQDTACGDDQDCLAFISCMSACTDPTCQTACETTYPTANNELNALDACLTSACAVPCGA